MGSLSALLDEMTTTGDLAQPAANDAVRCLACAHRCLIRPGRRGICKVRFNRNGALQVPWGYVAALQSDPVEKKPFFHLMPGSQALTFGMLGCDFRCAYCQNWLTSQALRDPASDVAGSLVRRITPEQIIGAAGRARAEVLVSSYNEPLITTEWAVSVFKQAKKAGLKCAFVSNGNATPEALDYLRPWLDAYKIDLKCMQDKTYRQLGGVLNHVLDAIRRAHALGLWVEIVTLVVPGLNDSNDELWDAARFLAGVSPDIPWHVTAFHKDYRMSQPENTPAHTLLRAAEIGREAGLRYVYAGNLPGHVEGYENTRCPTCNALLVRRAGYTIREYHLSAGGACPRCNAPIAGVWPANPRGVELNGRGIPLPAY